MKNRDFQNQQSRSVTRLISSLKKEDKNYDQNKVKAARKRGVKEHADFEKQVSYYYSEAQKQSSTFAYLYSLICLTLFFLIIAIVAFVKIHNT